MLVSRLDRANSGMNRGAGAHLLFRLMGPAAAAAGLLVLGRRAVRLVGVGVDEDIVRVSLWVWRWVVWTNETPIKGSIVPQFVMRVIRQYPTVRETLGRSFFFLLAF